MVAAPQQAQNWEDGVSIKTTWGEKGKTKITTTTETGKKVVTVTTLNQFFAKKL